VIGVVTPQRAGPVALLAVVAPYAYGLLVLALVPLAVLRRDWVLAAVVAVAATLAAVAYTPPPPPPPALGGDPDVTVLTWNLHGERAERVGLLAVLERWQPDVVVLQEAGDDAIVLLEGRMNVMRHPDAATPPGMILASRLPVLASGVLADPAAAWDRPRVFWFEVDADGRELTFVGVHLSFPAPIDSLPCPYCPARRDAQVSAVAQFASARAGAERRVVLVGDFNLTHREVAYRDLTGDFRDVARALSWRPLGLSWLPPMLRLDYVLIGPGLDVVATQTDCAISHSDHCPVLAALRAS